MEKKQKTMDDKIMKLMQNQVNKPSNTTSFYHRVVNKTDVIFSNEEIELLNKGVKYNLSKKPNQWIRNLALEAEAAITLLPLGEKEYVRHHVAKNIKNCTNSEAQTVHTMINRTNRTESFDK
jgi:hypothetical protein